MKIRPIKAMINHNTTEVFFDDLRIPASSLIGEEGRGFRYILDGMNAERILVVAESIGDARWFVRTAVEYANERVVFDRPIGQNQGIQFPIARAYAAAAGGRPDGAQGRGAVRSRACRAARKPTSPSCWRRRRRGTRREACMQTHGGFGFAREYDVERKWREARACSAPRRSRPT